MLCKTAFVSNLSIKIINQRPGHRDHHRETLGAKVFWDSTFHPSQNETAGISISVSCGGDLQLGNEVVSFSVIWLQVLSSSLRSVSDTNLCSGKERSALPKLQLS